MPKPKKPRNTPDSMIVSPAILAEVVDTLRKNPIDTSEELLSTEPALSKFLNEQELQLLGRMALAGAYPEFIRGFANELHGMVAVAVRSFRKGYADLLDPFLLMAPGEAETKQPMNSGENGPPPPPAAQDEDAGIPF